MGRRVSGTQGKIFLITNKHVVYPDHRARTESTHIMLHFNAKDASEAVSGRTAGYPMTYVDGTPRWREHPDRDVDVLAVDVTELARQHPEMSFKWLEDEVVASKEVLSRFDIAMGDEALIIGYPLGLRQGGTNFPLVRAGLIATRIGYTLEDEIAEPDGTRRKRTLRGFLIDCHAVPGSSGSPVILRPTLSRFVRGELQIGFPPNILLGILAETRYAPIHSGSKEFLSYAGLGLAFDAETVTETVDLFFA